MSNVQNEALLFLNEVVKNTLKGMPIWMKCNFLLNTIYQKEEVTIDELNQQIDWDKINELLKDSTLDIDYNIFDRINSIEELENLRMSSTTASIPEFNEPYYKKVCKTCGDEFTLTVGEVNWFKKKDLQLPCKCYYCRKKIQKPITQVKVEEKEEEPMKTAMQLALEKVGF